MNAFSHENNDKADLKRARRFQVGGVACILVSLVMNMGFQERPWLVYLAYPFLLAGLPLWTIGRSRQRKIAGAPRIDNILNAELKGLNDKYSVHHNPRVAGHEVDHIMVMPTGVLVLENNDALGPVTCTSGAAGDHWRTRTSFLDRLTGARPAIGNPSAELATSIAAVKNVLDEQGKPDVPVSGLIVFTANPELEIEESTYPAVPLSEIKQAVREMQDIMGGEREDGRSISAMLTSEDRKRLNSAISPQVMPTLNKTASARS